VVDDHDLRPGRSQHRAVYDEVVWGPSGMNCIFCRLDRPLFAETKLSFAFLDGFPVSNGHTLIIPKRHVASLWEMSDDEYTDAFDLVRRVKDILQEKFQPQGFNVGVNCGEAAGQSVFHAHIHIIPRYNGDVPSPRGGVRNIIPGKGNY
jgi:diadenosine tetraphosphate (Ap4A) HIT family hydrolase